MIAILEILHFVIHQSKKGIKKYYEANPDALKISEVKFFNPYESEKYRRKNFKGSIRTLESEKWVNWSVIYVNINKIHYRKSIITLVIYFQDVSSMLVMDVGDKIDLI